jgi:hypothetical protein
MSSIEIAESRGCRRGAFARNDGHATAVRAGESFCAAR